MLTGLFILLTVRGGGLGFNCGRPLGTERDVGVGLAEAARRVCAGVGEAE